MKQKRRIACIVAACAAMGLMLGVGLSLAGEPNINLSKKTGTSSYLLDGSGKTLYVFAKDVKDSGISACEGDCVKAWHPFFIEKVAPGKGISPGMFRTINRADGKKQTTFSGYPLYLYAEDKAPGDSKGEGVNKSWFLAKVPFYTVNIHRSENLLTLVDPAGKTLYFSKKDPSGTSLCGDDCAKVWPPFYQGQIVAPSMLADKDFGTITRPDKKKQTTYKGHPLYWNKNDLKPGQMNGQGKDEDWSVADPSKM